jgi:two-component system phosphate regulon response regulator PhoB
MSVSTNAKKRILWVEDEKDIRELVELHLLRSGHEVVAVGDGEQAIQKIQSEKFDLYLFDWMLPGASGLELVKKLRSLQKTEPVLMLTAKAEHADIVEGLEAGADDYVTKPFEATVLIARVRALLRRAAQGLREVAEPKNNDIYRLGDVTVNLASYEVKVGPNPLQLTPSEFKLLGALVKNQDRVLTRNQLIELIQGDGVSVVDRTVDTHVFGLRKKLGPSGDLIETVRGVGYRVRSAH